MTIVPGQLVISGYKEAVQSCMDALSEAGARRTVLLNVSGPFHSPLLSGAGKQLEKTLSGVVLDALEIPYVANVTGQFVSEFRILSRFSSNRFPLPYFGSNV